MENSCVLAFDVGGTTIKGAIVGLDGHVDENSFFCVSSRSSEAGEAIVDHLLQLIKTLSAKTKHIYGIGFAFPGPFDYEQGISYIQGLGKFDALYGYAVKEALITGIERDVDLSAMLIEPKRIVFGNDAELFALGEARYGEASRFSRSICLTIGTGLGSAFIEDGQRIREQQDVPHNGWLYPMPWADGIVDDYASRRGILQLAEEAGFPMPGLDVKDIADLAARGEAAAKLVFEQFGRRLGRILVRCAISFHPQAIVFGGQISESLELFAPSLLDELSQQGCMPVIAKSENTLYSTFRGINSFARSALFATFGPLRPR